VNINRAIKEANKSDHYHHKHATLLFKGSTLVATGYNLGNKHSEIMALNKVKHKMGAKGLIAFNVRLTKGGAIGMSRPCVQCEDALRMAGIKKTIFTNSMGNLREDKY